MMIAHASIPADHPEQAARVLAEIVGGQACRFPPGGPQSWMAWSADGRVELEIIARGQTLTYGAVQGDWFGRSEGSRHSECHLALCVDRPAAEVMAIAARAGWPARHCDRGGGLFQLTEVWVDGVFMLEIMDPAQTERYRQTVTPENWQHFLRQMEAA